MSALSETQAHSWCAGLLASAAGACAGRLLGVLVDRLSSAEGFSSPRYGAAYETGGWRARLPVVGHGFVPRWERSGRALAMELAVGGAFLACWLAFPPAKAACAGLFLAALIGASAIDLDALIIPDLFTIGLALAGLALSAIVPSLHGIDSAAPFAGVRSVAAALLGVAVGSALGLWISVLGEWMLGKEVLGFGDVKFLGAIGAFCGWKGAVFGVFGGALVGALALVLTEGQRRLARRDAVRLLRLEGAGGRVGRVDWGVHFPFGPMIAVAAALYLLALHPCVDRCLARYVPLFQS